MPRLKYDKNEVIIDWQSGQYTVRALASKHRISPALAGQIVKGVPKEMETLLDKQMEIKQILSEKDRQFVDKFNSVIDERTKHLDFIQNATRTNINRMMKKFDEKSDEYLESMSIMDNKLIQSTIKDARESLLGKEQAPAILNQTTNILQMSKEELLDRAQKADELRRLLSTTG